MQNVSEVNDELEIRVSAIPEYEELQLEYLRDNNIHVPLASTYPRAMHHYVFSSGLGKRCRYLDQLEYFRLRDYYDEKYHV